MYEKVISCYQRLKGSYESIDLTVKRLAVLAAALGVLGGLFAVLVPAACSLNNITSSYELWVVLVLMIALKSESEPEAPLMSGGVMLGARFIAAMIKTPFDKGAIEWFISGVPVVICFMVYAYLAKRFVSRDSGKSVWVMSFTAAVMILFGAFHLKHLVNKPVYQLFAVIFCIAAAAFFAAGLIKDPQTRVIASSFCGGALVIGLVLSIMHTYRYNCVLLLDSAKYPLTEEWSVSAEDEGISTPSIEKGADDEAVLEVTFYEQGDNTYTLTSPEGEEYEITVRYDGEDGVNVYDKAD